MQEIESITLNNSSNQTNSQINIIPNTPTASLDAKPKMQNFSLKKKMAFDNSIPEFIKENPVQYLGLEVSNVNLQTEAGSGRVVYAAPGEEIAGYADMESYRPRNWHEFTQAIVGFAGIGAQDALGKGNFTLTAPEKPGVYEVRFRYAQGWYDEDAIKNWWNVDRPPPEQATIALVVVSEDPENAEEIDFNGWMAAEYVGKESLPEGTSVLSTLTSDRVQDPDFWDASQTTGNWTVDGNVLSNKGTMNYNEYHQMVSKEAFKNFDLHLTQKYHRTLNRDKDTWWAKSRGFSALYYVSDERNVEFRYFADVGQLSLYIRDNGKVVEHMRKAYFPPGEEIAHDISVQDGKISWTVNGKTLFTESTSLKEGHLAIQNHNNSTEFTF